VKAIKSDSDNDSDEQKKVASLSRKNRGVTPSVAAPGVTHPSDVTAAGRRPLLSADNRTCLVKRSRNQFGDHCFATAGPTLWNSLPEQLRQPASLSDNSNDC